MVILNRVINILILLAAIAAVVFSYLLFSKREKLVNGWAQMAAAIQTTAKTLDDGGASGTAAAKDLPADKLKHENFDQLGSVLPKLKENTGKIVAQRNKLAESIQSAAKKLGIENVESKNLKNVSAYEDQTNKIFLKGVEGYAENHKTLAGEYANTFASLGAPGLEEKLKSQNNFRTAIDSGNLKVREVMNRIGLYETTLNKIANSLGLSRPQIKGAAYQSELTKMEKRVSSKGNELKKLQSQLADEKSRNQQLQKQIAGHRKTISDRNHFIQLKEKEISRLNNILDKDGSLKLPEKLLTSSDPECYQPKYIKNIMVEYVDKDYGFVQINAGKFYSFVQEFGTRKNRVLFPMKPGMILSVVRNRDTDNAQFIGKIVITKVDEKCSICNLVGGHPELYQVGDDVYFKEDDIAHALGNDKK